ncbi:hypothetical protein OPQ81_009389 [Rhizoctonia solani]|nr:hypothetical protein OPQ81_009389 [Rhizoctonia solani]
MYAGCDASSTCIDSSAPRLVFVIHSYYISLDPRRRRRQMSADSVQAPSSKSALRPHAPKHITLPQESTGSESSRTK